MISGWELVLVVFIILLIFGVGRIARVGRELGTGIREFRKGISGDDQPDAGKTDESRE